MRAAVGDTLVVHGHRTGEPDRTGEIIEVHATDGAPPYTVRWDEDGRVGLVFPGPDASVRTTAPAPTGAGGRVARPRGKARTPAVPGAGRR